MENSTYELFHFLGELHDVDTDCCNLHLVFSHFDCLQFNHGTPMPSVGGDHYIRLLSNVIQHAKPKTAFTIHAVYS